MTLDCMYSCNQCGIVKAHISIPVRSDDEDVVHWMETVVTPALVADHSSRSPHCRPKSLSKVYIPVTGADRIGGPTVN